jgi:hypothetical protein
MTRRILSLALVAFALFATSASAAATDTEVADQLLTLERQAMDGFAQGDPDPMLATLDSRVTYYHIVTSNRLDGIDAVRALCEQYRGRPLFDRYEIVDPKVQTGGDTAVLTYTLVRHLGTDATRWFATLVYQQKDAGWRVIHAHWSRATEPATTPAESNKAKP